MRPTVSIVIPTYNRPELLQACLGALAADPQPDKEVLVVNDAGPDVTHAIAPWQDALTIRLIDLPTNRGHVAARNTGVRAAQADVIVLCDDDDLLLPGHVQEMVREVQATPSQILYSDAEIVQYHFDGRCRQPLARELFAYAYDPAILAKWNTVIPSGVAYARSLHERIGLFDEEVHHYWDWDFFLRASALAPLRRVPRASVLYMVSDSGHNLSSQPERMTGYLERLQVKHNLGPLPTSSFSLMQQEPVLRALRRTSTILWDGQLPCYPDTWAAVSPQRS